MRKVLIVFEEECGAATVVGHQNSSRPIKKALSIESEAVVVIISIPFKIYHNTHG